MANSKMGCEETDSADLELKQKPYNNMKHIVAVNTSAEKLKSYNLTNAKSSPVDQYKLWAFRFIAIMFFLWVCALRWTSFQNNMEAKAIKSHQPSPVSFPRQRSYKNQGYLMISPNGGLNQMRAGICDMVAVATYLNVTLIVPELDHISFWHDGSQFEDIFDVDFFIKSLRDQVRILQELPVSEKRKIEIDPLYSMAPASWSTLSYYQNTILPRFEKYKVVHFTKTDTRLANNGIPEEIQKLRCRVMYKALRFASPIEEVGKKLVRILRENGPFLVLHLRYEMDMLAFSGCTEGCTEEEAKELTKMRYAYPWWKEKEINSKQKRHSGSCPLTPEETALALRALEIDPNTRIYIAAGDIYGGERRMAGLRAFYPYLVRKETLLTASDLEPFKNHLNQMAALDYLVSLASDIFVLTYGGNMAKVVEGHRRYLGYKVTINLDRFTLVRLIDQYRNGTLSWNEFSESVKAAHGDRMGGPTQRFQVPEKPKQEEYFYTNPQECLPPIFRSSKKRKPSASKEKAS